MSADVIACTMLMEWCTEVDLCPYTKHSASARRRGETHFDDGNPGFKARGQLVQDLCQELLVLEDFPHLHDSDNGGLYNTHTGQLRALPSPPRQGAACTGTGVPIKFIV